ncbi:hypothetical protein F5Y14DRAFT_415153 [Nemania sp. NC0429]|nr:hypothetical protein F5Y14DRAFT_415153 [Nemania sp. NC0429]
MLRASRFRLQASRLMLHASFMLYALCFMLYHVGTVCWRQVQLEMLSSGAIQQVGRHRRLSIYVVVGRQCLEISDQVCALVYYAAGYLGWVVRNRAWSWQNVA